MDGGNLEINNLEINIQESCAFMDFRPKGKLEINIQESCAFLDTGKRNPLPAKRIGANMCFARSGCTPKGSGPTEASPETIACFNLLVSAWKGEVELCRLRLREGADVDSHDIGGRSALMMAAMRGHVECAELLCLQGADVEWRDEDEWTSLMMAAHAGNAEMVMLLLRHGADHTFTSTTGASALMFAAHCGFTNVCTLLMEFDADPNQEDEEGMTALMFAARTGHADTCQALLAGGALVEKFSKKGVFALEEAANLRHVEACGVLVRATRLRVTYAFEVLNESLPLAERHSGPLMPARICGLLMGALNIAVSAYLPDEFTTLLGVMSMVDPEGPTAWSPLLSAARDGRKWMCEALLDKGARVDRLTAATDELPPECQRSALMLAAERGHLEVCDLLLKAGADVELTNHEDKSALRLCAEAAEALEADAWEADNLNNLNNLSCRQKYIDVCVCLLKAGAAPGPHNVGQRYVQAARRRWKTNLRKRAQRHRKHSYARNVTAVCPSDLQETDSLASPQHTPSSDSDSVEECCICLDEKPCVLLLPCEHRCACHACIARVRKNVTGGVCPICREPIVDSRDAFGSEGFVCY